MPNTPIAMNARTSGGLLPGWNGVVDDGDAGTDEVEDPGSPRAMMVVLQQEHL